MSKELTPLNNIKQYVRDMKIEATVIDGVGCTVLKEVFNGVILETRGGNQIGIYMRDDTMDINVMPKGKHTGNWWRVDMQEGEIVFDGIAKNSDDLAPLTKGDKHE